MTTPKCGDCKHFDRDGDHYEHYAADDPEDIAQRVDVIRKDPRRICLRIVHGNSYSHDVNRDVVACVTDASGYRAYLWVHPEKFWCPLFEEAVATDAVG